LAFTNLNGVTLSLSSGAGGSHTIVGSHNALTSQSNQAASASNGSFAFQTLNFSNANNVTFGTSAGGIVTASVAAPGAAAENNWFTLIGNVAGNSSASGSTIALSGGNNVTLSGTNNSVIVISAAAGGGGVTFPGIQPYDDLVQVVSTYGNGSLILDPQPLPNFAFDRIGLLIQNTNSSNSSGSHTLRFTVGLYTRNDASLSLMSSWTGSTAVTQSGTGGTYSQYSGKRLFVMTQAAATITENRYWIGFVSSTSSAGANGSYSNYMVSNLNSTFLGIFGSPSTRSAQPKLGQGFYSASTTALPASIAFSQIDGTNTLAMRFPVIGFGSSTA
jgi:hypothetical protein